MEKMIMVLLLITTFGIASHAQQATIKDLVGKWDAVDAAGEHGSLEIVDSTQLFLTFQGLKKPILGYTADFTKTPVWFDFTVKQGEDTVHFKSILNLITDNKMQWQIFNGNQHPSYFSKDKGNMVYLMKRK